MLLGQATFLRQLSQNGPTKLALVQFQKVDRCRVSRVVEIADFAGFVAPEAFLAPYIGGNSGFGQVGVEATPANWHVCAMTHSHALRVYYEDTDLGGFVYYANYLKFIERGRSEWVRGCGVDQMALKADRGLLFVVRHLEADYLAPAYFEDALLVETERLEIAGSRIVLAQRVMRGDAVLFAARVTLVCVEAGRAVRVPTDVAALLV